MNRLHKVLLSLAALMMTGCAGMKPGMGFDDDAGAGGVRQSVAERTGMKVHWNNGSKEDAEAAAAVSELLEHNLTAEAAAQVALLNNHELQAVYEELNLAQADLVQAGLLRNPVFSGEVRWATSGSEGPGVVLDLTQDFVSLFYLPLRKGRAEAAFEAAKLRVSSAVVDMAAEVRSAFYEYQSAEQTREMRKTVLEATQASYELAQRLRVAGNNRDLDVLNERDLMERAKVDLALAEEDVTRSRERLNALMGLWGKQTQWRAEALLPSLPAEDMTAEGLEKTAIERSLDLGIARREIEIAARALGIAKPFGWLTDTEVGVAAERDLDGTWSVGPSLSLPVPLFDQGQGAVGKAQAQLRQASEHYHARAVEVRSRARAAHAVVASARSRARYYQQVILPLRQQIVDQTQQQYNGMQVSAFQLLEAKRNQIEAGTSYIEALRDYWVARTKLEQVLSGRLTAFEGTGASSLSAMPHSGLGEEPGRPLQHRHTGAKPIASPE
jgi:cobalt-zinc-cadmium efflux system outer membrane protein